MHTLRVSQPRPQVRPFVRTFAQCHIEPHDPGTLQAIPVQLEQLLTFELGTRPEIHYHSGRARALEKFSTGGAQTQLSADIRLPAGADTFGIFFQPAGLSQLFAVPIWELTDWFGNADSVLGRCIRELWNRLGETPLFEKRVTLAEEFLLVNLGNRFGYHDQMHMIASDWPNSTNHWVIGENPPPASSRESETREPTTQMCLWSVAQESFGNEIPCRTE